MKAKALKFRNSEEYILIDEIDENYFVFTSEFPYLQPMTANLEEMIEFSNKNHHNLVIDWDNVEMVELDIIDSGEVGADIRNKLTPPKNLVALLEAFFDDVKVHYSEPKRAELAKLIKKEMEQTKKSVNYLKELL